MELKIVGLLICSCMLGQFEVGAENLFPNWAATCNYRQRDFRLIAKGLSDALNFLDSQTGSLVLDAAVGTRILEGQLQVLLDSNLNIPNPIRRFIRRTLRKSGRISGNIIENIRMDPNISDQVKANTLPWVTSTHLWSIPRIHTWTRLTDSNAPPPANETREVMNEEVSDACIGHLFQGCGVSPSCQDVFLRRRHTLYSLTHQAIFMIVTKQLECDTVPEFRTKFPSQDSSQFHGSICSKILMEANAISEQDFPQKQRDLFVEQVAVCSLAGYEDFMKPEWMYEILFWEKTLSTNSACFTSSDSDDESTQDNTGYEQDQIPRHRRKRSDVLIDMGTGTEADTQCSAHFTAVSVAALALHLRYLLETCQV